MNRSTYFYFRIIAALALTMIITCEVSAQDSIKNLSLKQAIQATLENNKNVRLATLDSDIAAANYEQTQAIFLPQIDLSYTAMNTNDPLNSFGFTLQQREASSGDLNPGALNHPSATNDFTAKVEVEQPLLNIDMQYVRKGVKKEIERYKYAAQRVQELMTFEARKAYLQLQLDYETVKVLKDAQETARSVYTFTYDHFKQGLVQRSDLLNAQVHLTAVETKMARAKSSIKNASDYLSLLMGQPAGAIYQISEQQTGEPSGIDTLRHTFTNRSDLMAMQKGIEASGLMIKSSQMNYLPKLNAFAHYQYNGSDFTSLHANAYLVGIKLSWNVFDGNKTRHVIATQKLEQNKLTIQLAQQKDQSRAELDKANRDLYDARFEMAQGRAAIEQGAEALRILQNRYQQGLVNTTDVLAANTQLTQLRFSLVQARFASDITWAYLQLLTSTTTK